MECSSSFLAENSRIFGGGISFLSMFSNSFTKAIVAGAGLPRYCDGALILVLAIDMQWLNVEGAREIAQANANPYFEVLLKASR